MKEFPNYYKGQLTSKGLFDTLEFLQKNEQNNSIIVLLGKKMNSFVHFLEEFEDSKSPFEINWPSVKIA